MKGKILIGLCLLMAACLPDEYPNQEAQLLKEVQAIDEYLLANSITAIKDATGIRIQIITLGTEPPPNRYNRIEVDYIGRLFSNNQIFDQGTTASSARLKDFISGWQIGLSMLPKGSIAKLYIPSYYAYGSAGSGQIPANATLVFDVEIEDVYLTATQLNKLAQDTVAIDNYLVAQNVQNVIKHESGIRYVFNEEGIGAAPTSIYDQIKINYEGKLLPDGTLFLNQVLEPSTTFSCRLVNFPKGLLIGMQEMQEGDVATFYIPSLLAYGDDNIYDNNGAILIPANSNISIKVTLQSVIP